MNREEGAPEPGPGRRTPAADMPSARVLLGLFDPDYPDPPYPPPQPPPPPPPPYPPYPPPYAGPRVDRNDYYTQCRRYAVANNEAFSSWRWRNGQHDDCPCIPGNHCSYTCRLQCDTPTGGSNKWARYQYLTVTWISIYAALLAFLCFFCKYRYRRWRTRDERAVRREVRAAERAALKLEALDIELASLPLPSYSCVQPDGNSVVVVKETECHLEMRRRERLRHEAMADERVTVKHVSDAAWVERRLSTVIAVSDEDTDADGDGFEDGGGGEGGGEMRRRDGDDGERDDGRGRSTPAR